MARDAARQFGGKATPPENIHLTLNFLGNVAVDALPLLCAVARQIRIPAFVLSLDQINYWPRQKLLLATCRTQPAALSELVSAIRQHLATAGFSGRQPDKVFTPHVTLLRKVEVASVSSELVRWPSIAPLVWSCTHFSLLGSHLSPQGSIYQTIAEFPLSA